MKHIKSLTIFLIAFATLAVFNGCKRGADDPFFSFRSRKDRVTGDWKIDYFDSQLLQKLQNGYIANRHFTINGDNVALIVDSINTPHDTTVTINGIVKESEYNFDKNSKMTYLLNYELDIDKISIDENTNVTTYDKTVETYTDRATGSWNFLGRVEINGVQKYKNKERISFIYESYYSDLLTVHSIRKVDENGATIFNDYSSSRTTSEKKYANGENAQIWVLQELRNKKIVATRDVDNVVQNTFISNDSTSVAESYSEKGPETLRLVPRQ
jgi:hypothetical protein